MHILALRNSIFRGVGLMILNVSGRRMITAYAVYAVLHFCTIGSLCLGTTAALADVSTPPSTTASSDTKLLDEVWRQVRDNFYDPKLHELDWQAVGDEHRPDYVAATTDAERSAVINAMLGKLGASHTRHYSKDEPAYFQLLEIFSYPLRDGIKRMFGSSKPTYTGIGIFTKELDGRTFVSGVMAGLAGSKAGLLVGDEIVNVDDKRFEPIGSFRGKAGQPVRIEIRRHKEGPTRRIIVVPEVIEPGEAFQFVDHARHPHHRAKRPPHRSRTDIVLRGRHSTEVGAIKVTATLADHSGFRPPFGPTADAVGYLLDEGNERVYFAGDTDAFPQMADLTGIDLALLPVWGWGPRLGPGHMNPRRAAEALTLLQPRVVVPIHWGTLWPMGMRRVRPHLLHGPPQEFAALAAEMAPAVEVLLTQPGETVDPALGASIRMAPPTCAGPAPSTPA